MVAKLAVKLVCPLTEETVAVAATEVVRTVQLSQLQLVTGFTLTCSHSVTGK